jgi:hypothetical protein
LALDIGEFAYLIELGGKSIKGEFGFGAASAAKTIRDIANTIWDVPENLSDDLHSIIGLANFIESAGSDDRGNFGHSAARAAIRIREVAQRVLKHLKHIGRIGHDN